jgi:hypothetical protein
MLVENSFKQGSFYTALYQMIRIITYLNGLIPQYLSALSVNYWQTSQRPRIFTATRRKYAKLLTVF